MLARLAAVWGVAGVCGLLILAVTRLSSYVGAMFESPLTFFQGVCLVIFVVFMAYSEGYRGFQKAFAPRVVARAQYLQQNPRPLWMLLAPFFCMSYFAAPRKRILVSVIITSFIFILIKFMRFVPQPWRGIIDAGVVVGLSWGVLSILFCAWQAWRGRLDYPVQVSD